MGQAVAVQGAATQGHGAFPPTSNAQAGGGTVFVNGVVVLVEGDPFILHCDTTPVCHIGTISEVSSKVFVGGKGIARQGDGLNCGDKIANGSSNVTAG
jgi:uncharacterized Zn-binding protein involved in type VI secretion